jgi:hypothetical protein
MSGSKSPKVLRVAVIVDGESCEELHQTEPGDILIERASGSGLSVGPSSDIEVGVAAEGGPSEYTLPRILMLIGMLMVVIGGGLFTWEVSKYVNENAVLEKAPEEGTTTKESDPTSTIALVVGLLGVIPLVTGSTMLRGRRRRRRQQVTVYDGWAQPKDHRKNAPIWLGIGAVLILGGGGLFTYEVSRHMGQSQEAADVARGDMSAYRQAEQEGTGGLGLMVLMIGIVPLVVGLMGLREEPVAPRKRPPKGSQAPGHHKLFEWVASEGVYYIDIPPETRGKIALGANKATVEQLRKRFGQGDKLRVKLGAKAKGKLLIGQTRILFQTASVAAEPPKPSFPAEFVDPLALVRPTSLEVATLAAATGVAMLLAVWFMYFADRTPPPPSERFVREMGLPVAFEEEKEEEPVEEAEKDALEIKDDKKEEEKQEEIDESKLTKPDNVSDAAFQQARGVGVARVLGTYGGEGPGTVLDVIESTENNLGDLFAQGMSQTAEYQGGQIGDFVAGGGGITATGTVASNEGLQTGEGPAEVGGTEKKERAVKGSAKGTTENVFGDVDKKAVSATIRQRMPGLQACYEKALRSNPGLKGKITYTITINPQGRVTDVSIDEDTVNDASVKSCTIGKIKEWRFFSEGAEDSSEVTFGVSFTGT